MKKLLTAFVLLNLVSTLCLLGLLRHWNSKISSATSDFAQVESPVESEISGIQVAPSISEEDQSVRHQTKMPQFSESTIISSARQSQVRVSVLPLVFEEVDLSRLNLNLDQLQAIEDLRQRFLDEIGGLHQDPEDPGYRERWNKSRQEIDNDLRGMIGVTAFQDYQLQATDLAQKQDILK